MTSFASSLRHRKNEITDDIYDMLSTFTDFQAFKEMMVDCMKEKSGLNDHFVGGLVVHSIKNDQ